MVDRQITIYDRCGVVVSGYRTQVSGQNNRPGGPHICNSDLNLERQFLFDD